MVIKKEKKNIMKNTLIISGCKSVMNIHIKHLMIMIAW